MAQLRFRLDPVAQIGVPAHVTVLFPFIPASEIRDDVLVRLAALFRPVPAFTHNFVRTAWFGDQTLWRDSDAAPVFQYLTHLVWSAFPAYPPYDGQFDEIVPHLTIADHGPVDEMQAAERTVQRYLPIRAITRTVTLMVEQPSGRWDTAKSFPLSS